MCTPLQPVPSSHPPKQVLLIDDEANMREVIQTCLEMLAGWTVQSVESGREGLVWLEHNQPDVILLDVMMPEMDGFTFLERLRANPATQSIPVILITARSQTISSQTITQLGILSEITKPFDPLQLAGQIAQLLGWKEDSP